MRQEFFDPIEYDDRDTALEAKKTRTRELRKAGEKIVSSILKNQLQPYSGLGCPDGRVRDVFMITVY